MPRHLLEHTITHRTIPSINRLELYSFANVDRDFRSWQTFHRAWTDYTTDHSVYDQLGFDVYLGRLMVCAIHPHEFVQVEYHIYEEYTDKFLYVELDPRHLAWVQHSQSRLGFVLRPNETEQFKSLRHQWNMKKIDLSLMLDSQAGFVQEYERICQVLGIDVHTDQALTLYQDWRAVRF